MYAYNCTAKVTLLTLLGNDGSMRRNRHLALAGLCVACVVVLLWYPGLPGTLGDVLYNGRTIAVRLERITYTQIFTERANQTSRTNDSVIAPLLKRHKLMSKRAVNVQNFSELNHKALILWNLKRRLQLLPIKCFMGSDGLFPSKYEKLLLSLAEYATFHSTASDARQLIWKCGPDEGICGGLADRLRGIAYTLLLAVFSGRRLLLHWGMPNGEHIYLKPNLINWMTDESSTEDVIAIVIKDDMSGINIPTAMEAIGSNLTKVAIFSNLELEAVNKQVFRPQWLTDGLGRTGLDNLTNDDINEIFGIAFRYLFQIRGDLFLKVNSATRQLGLDVHKYIGVHIRTGFVESETPEEPHAKLVREVHQWEQILTCAVSIANNGPIFLATDSKSVKMLAAKMYGSQYKTLRIKLVHTDGIDKSIGPDMDESEGLLAAWVDFFLLAQSYVQVRTGHDWIHASGFALGASHLCGLPRSQRIEGLENCTSEDRLSHSSLVPRPHADGAWERGYSYR